MQHPVKPDLRRLAVLIDAENADARRIEPLLNEVARYGMTSVKRAYGDWATPSLAGKWKERINRLAIQPVQQFGYIKGKNASDIALVIDAMDLLHSGDFGALCIVSIDSDFTRLACRLRESGITVYGSGERTTPESFVRACDQFLFHDDLAPEEEGRGGEKAVGRASPFSGAMVVAGSGPASPGGGSGTALPDGAPAPTSPLVLTPPDPPARAALGQESYDGVKRLCSRLGKTCFDVRKRINSGVPPTDVQVERLLGLCASALALLQCEGKGDQP
jgi:hypothetical protein